MGQGKYCSRGWRQCLLPKARTINRKLDQSVGSPWNPTGSSQVLENQLFSIIAHIANIVKNNVISSTKPLLTTHLTTYNTVTAKNKHTCLPLLLFSCLFSPPHPFYLATYTCIDKSDFQNGDVGVPTLYFALLPGSELACFEGYSTLKIIVFNRLISRKPRRLIEPKFRNDSWPYWCLLVHTHLKAGLECCDSDLTQNRITAGLDMYTR